MEKIHEISESTEIRQKAEILLHSKHSQREEQLCDADTLKLIHELEVHQIELELQNEDLMLTREEARNAARKYETLFNSAPTSFFTLSKDGEILDLNLCGSQLLGKERESLTGSQFGFFVSPDTRFIYNYFLEQVFNSRKKETCEVTLKTEENGLPVYVFLSGITTRRGEECLLTVFDITERKRAIEVTIEKQRLGAIGEMATSIAHDFNNSLQTILGNLELAMQNTEVNPNTLKYMKIMQQMIRDAATRVQHLQRFGGKSPCSNEYRLVNLNTLAEEVIAQSRPLWKDDAEIKGLTITFVIEFDDIPEIFGNEGELRTVLFNIIKNSIEAMPQGGEITIRTGMRPEGVFISVKDTGTGMNEDTRARIFQPFYSTKGFDLGRGLGMSGVLSIIKEHKGEVYVKNTQPGKGSTIEILFPSQHKKAETDIIETEHDETEDISKSKTLNILWVDDEDGIRLIASEMVKLLGHREDSASSGKDALKLLESNSYDVVVTDIGMPVMNGWQLADIIRKKYEGKNKNGCR